MPLFPQHHINFTEENEGVARFELIHKLEREGTCLSCSKLSEGSFPTDRRIPNKA